MALDTLPVPLAVTTRCPSCTGRLEFAEGTSSLQCPSCGSPFLVTGRRRVVSYLVRAEIDAPAAAAIAGGDPSGGGPATAELWYVPYYRFTGTELRREREAAPTAGRGGPADPRWLAAWPIAFALAGGEAPELFASPRDVEELWRARPDALRFAARRVERTLRASTAEIVPPSLGVRSGQLRVALLHDGVPLADARVVAPAVSAEKAFREALGSPRRDELLRREIVARVLSLLYYPFWIVARPEPDAGRLAVVDGCSGAIVCGDASREERAALGADAPFGGGVLPLRPHVCPNCANDLPVAPADVVFHCDSCDRAWLVEGDRLEPVAFAVGEPPARVSERAIDYHPFWEVPHGAGGERSLVAAFLRGSLRRRSELAAALTRRSDRLDLGGTGGHGRRVLRGCAIDAADAAAIAGLLGAGDRTSGAPLLPRRHRSSSELGPERPRLLWLPFVRDAYGWREPTTGMALMPEPRA